MKKFHWFMLLVLLVVACFTAIFLSPNEPPAGFTDNYEAGDFAKYAADINGTLAETPLYIEGVMEKYSTELDSILLYSVNVNGSEWLVGCYGPMIYRYTTPDSLLSREVVICGEYMGVWAASGLPVIYVHKIFMKDNGGVYFLAV